MCTNTTEQNTNNSTAGIKVTKDIFMCETVCKVKVLTAISNNISETTGQNHWTGISSHTVQNHCEGILFLSQQWLGRLTEMGEESSESEPQKVLGQL